MFEPGEADTDNNFVDDNNNGAIVSGTTVRTTSREMYFPMCL
jgi:hypothetical protein